MVAVGPNDWAAGLGLFGEEADAYLAPRIDRLISLAAKAGKTIAMGVSNPEQVSHYYDLGARLFLIGGTDIAIKRKGLTEAIAPFADQEIES